ncbi:MAG: hypothetical protein ABIF10_01770 [Candidatus Woesearchaeota archaeon]
MTRDKFIKIYSNLYDDVRKEVIVVIDKKPYTWNAAYQEVKNDTELGRRILEKLSRMGLVNG